MRLCHTQILCSAHPTASACAHSTTQNTGKKHIAPRWIFVYKCYEFGVQSRYFTNLILGQSSTNIQPPWPNTNDRLFHPTLRLSGDHNSITIRWYRVNALTIMQLSLQVIPKASSQPCIHGDSDSHLECSPYPVCFRNACWHVPMDHQFLGLFDPLSIQTSWFSKALQTTHSDITIEVTHGLKVDDFLVEEPFDRCHTGIDILFTTNDGNCHGGFQAVST